MQSLEGDDVELKHKKKVNRRVRTCQIVSQTWVGFAPVFTNPLGFRSFPYIGDNN